MKKLVITSTLAFLATAWSMVGAQDYPAEYLGLPGDNLNLYATMKLFQESETLESFEKNLNDENSRINNLDLNGDNYIDYIMVIDYVNGDTHSIVLRAALNKDETQDVAVFTVQRLRDGEVQVQLIGDEALYGKNYIIEPIYADSGETPNPGYIGNSGNTSKVTIVRTTTYEVAAWPVVRYIYLPTYVSWHSSWYWGYYPSYWNPWRPFYWHTYYGYHYNWHNHYYRHYRTWNYNRCNIYNNFYYNNVRSYSTRVNYRIKSGHYRTTYSRPDLRKDGEALYARTNSGHNARTRDNVSGSSVNRGTENSRNSTTVGTSRNSKNNSAGKATEISQGVEINTSARVAGSSNVARETNTSRKSAEVSNSRAVKSTSVGQNNGSAPRSSANVSNRNVSSTREASRSVSSRISSGQGQTKSAVSSRSSSGQSRSSVSSGNSGNQSRSAVKSGNSGSNNRSSGSTGSRERTSSSGNSGRR
jgi:hypothetical protein